MMLVSQPASGLSPLVTATLVKKKATRLACKFEAQTESQPAIECQAWDGSDSPRKSGEEAPQDMMYVRVKY